MQGEERKTASSFADLATMWKEQQANPAPMPASSAEVSLTSEVPATRAAALSVERDEPSAPLSAPGPDAGDTPESEDSSQELKAQNQNLESELNEARQAIQDLTKNINRLRGEASSLKREAKRLDEDLEEEKSRNQRAEKQLEQNRNTIEDIQRQSQELEKKFRALKREKQQQVRRLNAEKDQVKAELATSSRHLKAAMREIGRMKRELEHTAALQIPLKWLAEGLGGDTDIFDPEVVIAGSMPFSGKSLASHFRARGVKSRFSSAPTVEFMIVGREDWDELELEKQIYAREGEALKVYSQEMALTSLAVGRDMLTELPREVLLELGNNHPALSFLIRSELQWPSCHPPALPKTFEPFEFDRGEVDQSPLKQLGYTVGKTQGLQQKFRQQILRSAFLGEMPWTHSAEYMAEWGQPGTRRRLWRIANHLAWLARRSSRLPSFRFAVGDWADDLTFMHREFFKPYMRFKWPHTRVPGRRH